MKKSLLILIICIVLVFPVLGVTASGSLLSPAGTVVTAGNTLKFSVNLAAIPEEYIEYTLTIRINPAPENTTLFEDVPATESTPGKYTFASADLSGVSALNFEILPGSNITSETSYSVTAALTSETGYESDQFSFIVKPAEEPVKPDPDDPTEPTKPTKPVNPSKPNMQSSFSGLSGGVIDSTLVYTGSADNYLEKLGVSGYKFTQNFNKTKNTYFVTVEKGVTSLDVSATASDSSADISVTGNTDLSANGNKIQVNVTAENGDVRIYRIYVSYKNDKEE